MIYLKQARLTAFGKFRNKQIDFSDGLQIFYGENESGKSTLQLFVKTMLYGVPNQRKSAAVILRDRERMIPWNEKYAEGVLTVSYHGKEISVYRRIGRTAAGDRLEVTDAVSGETLREFSAKEVGEILFDIPVEVFEKTFWIRQGANFPTGSDEELNRRLMNLRESGEEGVSAERIREQLEQTKKSLRAKDKRGVPGILDNLYRQKEEKLQERYRLVTQREQYLAERKRYEDAKIRLQATEEESERLKELAEKQQTLQKAETQLAKRKEANRLRDLLKQTEESVAYQRFATLTDETVAKAESIKRKTETLDQSTQIGYDKKETESKIQICRQTVRQGNTLTAVGIGVLMLSLISGVLRIPFWYLCLAIGAVIGIGSMLFGGFRKKGASAELQNLSRKLEDLTGREDAEKQEKNRLAEELQEILSQYSCQTAEELRQGREAARKAELEAESYRNAYRALTEDAKSDDALPELSEEDQIFLRRNLTQESQKNQEQRIAILHEMKDLEGKLSYVYRGGRNPADAEAEILQIEEKITETEQRFRAAELAERVFQEVYEQRRTEFAPQVNAKMQEFQSVFASGDRTVHVSDSYRMKVRGKDGTLQEAEYFSQGAYEQMYFSLRLALGTLIGNGEEPLFLDDFLTSFDDVRAKQAVLLLQKLSKNRQIFLFTCHSRVKEFGQEVSAVIRNLEEEIKDVG